MPEVRKLVTILFADVTGSTALGESLDPEDLRALMGRYYQHARRIIAEHGGTLEKFIGDAVMAIFGLPQAHSNDAERALAAALALRDALASDMALAGRLALRLGVNTGQVVATASGQDVTRGDFLVTGDAVNVAARLEQSAQPGEILVSARTANAAEASFIFGSPRQVSVKGKSQPLTVYPLAAQRPARRLGRPPLIGRKRDLAMLALLTERALEERRPQLVSIVAPAGTGKTRLLEEFLARLSPDEGWRIGAARCLPYGQTLTYWPLRGLLDELLGAPFSLERVTQVFAAGGYAPDDAQRLAGVVLTALGAEADGRQVEREALFNAWRLLIEALAKAAPRIVVFEDLHWASESLLDLVEHVMQPRTEAALLIAATGRPELLDRRPGWGGGRRNFTALALDPLSAADTRALVGKLAKRASETTRVQVAERSGGNPFFAIELARGLDRQNGAPENLPDTVQEAVQERLDALQPTERAVLQAAAVAGRAFRPAALRATIDELDPATVETALESLLARDLIMPAESGSYTFRHILIRDVAYNALARAERIRLHTAVARWLEEFAADRIDEFVELIAYHELQAVQLARQSTVALDAPLDTSRAIHYLERAGALASQAGAIAEAREHLRRAIELAPAVDHPRLYETLGDCAPFGDTTLDAYQRAVAAWRAEVAPDARTGARLLRKLLGCLMRWIGPQSDGPSREEMIALRAEARRLADEAEDEYETWRLRAVDLFWSSWTGVFDQEQTRADREVGWEAAAYFEAREDWAAFSEALDGYAALARGLGDYRASAETCRRRLAAPDLPILERASAIGMLTRGQCDDGAYHDALEIARAAIAQRRPGDPVIALGASPTMAGIAAHLTGRWLEIAPFVALEDAMWDELRHEPGLGFLNWGHFLLMRVALARNDRDTAEREAAAMTARMSSISISRMTAWRGAMSLIAALISLELQEDSLALQAASSLLASQGGPIAKTFAIALLSERGRTLAPAFRDALRAEPLMKVTAYLGRIARIAFALADDDNAQLAAAIDDAEAGELIPHAARMRVVLAQRTGDRAQLERARPILERLGDKQFLRRLEEIQDALT
jgi:class 3 adenylate cyclase